MEGQSENKEWVKAKKMATQVILNHSCSTPDEPKHHCSSSRKSCDLKDGANCHKPVKNPFPEAVVEVLQPLFDETFFIGDQYCYTKKKRNKKLHHVI